MSKKKKVPLRLVLFYPRHSRTFFSRTRRQSLPLGRFRGCRATQKVDQAKTGARTRPWSMLCGHGPAVTASDECTRIMYAGRTQHPRSNRRGRPTNGYRLLTTLVDNRAKRGVVAKNTRYFFLAFFFLESAATTYTTSVRLYISSTKSSSAILTLDSWSPPEKYPDLKNSDRSEHFFKPGDISVPSPLFAFLRIRPLIPTNLVETRARLGRLLLFERSGFLIATCRKKKTDRLDVCPDVRIISWF